MHIDSLKFERNAYGGVETRAERLFLNRNSSETLKFQRKSRTVANSESCIRFSMNSARVFELWTAPNEESEESLTIRGNKIITAQIQNNIKLLDSYSIVTCALSKFPKIFAI